MLNIGVQGADGRVGQIILHKIKQADNYSLSYALVADISPNNGKDTGLGISYTCQFPNKEEASKECDVFIDFSLPIATEKCLDFCAAHGIPMVIGTTGHSKQQQQHIHNCAKKIGIVQSSNMSSAINACFILIEQATRLLGMDYDIEILEKHHKHKKDAPSGTALEMGNRVAKIKGDELEKLVVYDRSNLNKERKEGSIGMQVIRGGELVGEHEIMFISEHETVALSHIAYSRGIFAAGALRAACWLVDNSRIGLYSMGDVLNS